MQYVGQDGFPITLFQTLLMQRNTNGFSNNSIKALTLAITLGVVSSGAALRYSSSYQKVSQFGGHKLCAAIKMNIGWISKEAE